MSFVPTEKLDGFVEDDEERVFLKFFPKLQGNEDYTSIVSDRHYDRLRHLVSDARDKGATVVTVNPGRRRKAACGQRECPAIEHDHQSYR